MTTKPSDNPRFETRELQWVQQYLRHLEEELTSTEDRVDLLFERTAVWDERLKQIEKDYAELKPLLKLQDQFIQRTQLLLEMVDRLQRQFSEVSARYQQSNGEIMHDIDARLTSQQTQIANFGKDSATERAARIGRVKDIAIAVILAVQTIAIAVLSSGQK